MYSGFADGLLREVLASSVNYPLEDRTAPHEEKDFIVSADPKGTLAWSRNYIQRPGRPKSHVVEELTEQVSPDYLAYLRDRGVSYVFAGKEQLDCPLLLHKLKTCFGIDRLMVSGSGYMNGSLLQDDLIDEVSIVIAPVADGNTTAVSIFERGDFLPRRAPVAFSLLDAKKLEGDGLWLRYEQKCDVLLLLVLYSNKYEKRYNYENKFWKQPLVFSLPVLIIGTYNENGNPDAMNAAWGGLYDRDRPGYPVGQKWTPGVWSRQRTPPQSQEKPVLIVSLIKSPT